MCLLIHFIYLFLFFHLTTNSSIGIAVVGSIKYGYVYYVSRLPFLVAISFFYLFTATKGKMKPLARINTLVDCL